MMQYHIKGSSQNVALSIRKKKTAEVLFNLYNNIYYDAIIVGWNDRERPGLKL